jgi:preprotein translocase subunit SecG
LVYFLYGLFFVSCIVLIGAVLLQPGKTDAGALFTSNISSTSFTPRGAQTVLSKLTIISATVFMLSALMISMPALTGNVSVLQTTTETSSETAPALDANSNTASNANAAAPAGEAPASNTAADNAAPAQQGTDKPAADESEEKGVEKPAANASK